MDSLKGKKKRNTDIEKQIGAQLGSTSSANFQRGTDAAHAGMDLFLAKGYKLQNVGFEQGKGNLFEFIEGAKLQKNLANAGEKQLDIFAVTDVPTAKGGFGEHTAPDDFRLIRDGRKIISGQAKINNDPHKTAVNFANTKYKGMQRNTTIDSVPDVRAKLDQMLAKGEISKAAYTDACDNLTGCLTDPETGVSSGGTTKAELEQFRGEDGKISWNAVKRYAKQFEARQYRLEIAKTPKDSALSCAMMTCIVSGTKNFFDVFQNKKELSQAIKDIGGDVGKSGVRGGITGFLSSVIRIGGSKAKLPVLSDGCAATAIAGGIVDGGVAIYEYTKGEISSKELSIALRDTIVKTTSTVYFTKALGMVCPAAAASPLIAIAAYTAASQIINITREIIENAKLNAEEHRRAARLNAEATQWVKDFRKQLNERIECYEKQQRLALNSFLETFDYDINTGKNYDNAIYAMVKLASQTGVLLQHVDFDEYTEFMKSPEHFVLKHN